MNILYDYQTFVQQKYGGISRYHVELIKGINTSDSEHADLSLLLSNNIHIKESNMNVSFFNKRCDFPGERRALNIINRLYSIYCIQNNRFDIFHPTYYDSYFLPYLKNTPFVVTFHDMIYEKLGNQFKDLKQDKLIVKNKKLLAERADRIIAVSECTKKDIVEILDINPEKIKVIHHGNSLLQNIPTLSSDSTPYLLYVGNRSLYKNFSGLLRSIYNKLRQYKVKLVCAGGGAFTKEEKDLIAYLELTDFVEQRTFDDNILPVLYKNAIAFIFPSLYEGFGIPILEAFACDCPCILSNTSSLPEVAGDAALYFDATDVDSICNAVDDIISDSALRQTLILKGRGQLSKFSWQHTIDQTLNVYQTLMK